MPEPARTSLPAALLAEVDAALAPVDAERLRRYPGERQGRQPVHTVYVPADSFGPDTVAAWGREALALLDAHAPDAASLAAALGLPGGLAGEVYPRMRAKLHGEPVEDLRVDFEDGYGVRADEEEDAAALRAARVLSTAALPFLGIRIKCLEGPVRARAVRTLDVFLTGLLEACGSPERLPAGLTVTLPKVTDPAQVAAMAKLCAGFERARGLPDGRLGFEVQVETTQAVCGPDGTAAVARFIDAGDGRVTGLHYGTFDYSAACGVDAAYQALDHPAADHAKAVMQVAAAGRGVWLSDGSTNVVPAGSADQVRAAWRLHHSLVRRSLVRAYHQGWDMHPGHLPTRFAAVYAFYREGMASAASRLAAYAAGANGATVLDEPATARALASFLLRGVDCRALGEEEVAGATGLARPALERLAGRTG